MTIAGHPLTMSPGFPATVSRGTAVRFQDQGLSLDATAKNGFSAPFAYSG